MYKVGDKVEIVFDGYLKDRDVKPAVIMGEQHIIQGIVLDSKGNQHLNIGLKSHYNYIRSQETNEELPNGHILHYIHPSRVKKVK